MATNLNIADQCVTDITAKLNNAVGRVFGDKVFYVYDQETFFDTTKSLSYPCAGVVYEGIHTRDKDKAAGRSTMIQIAVVIIAGERTREVTGAEDKAAITAILDTLRKAIIGTLSPTGHKWDFVFEIPAEFGAKQKGLGYYQRWAANVIVH